ncbi:unnamed protein product [Parnassius apollo]|uniref:(apollo) hypothetical protein n=1 Tax=Parnassius apollo TaxID=110799 RepID=A0A8S3WB66_PARAO|nr:unnamed protein product [Parnassius apollo]
MRWKNISIFKPKKDECELCTAYKSGNLRQSDYDQHVAKKDEARDEKVKDKETEKHVFAMDLQAVLLCPKSNVSSLYYKMKLRTIVQFKPKRLTVCYEMRHKVV